MTVTEISCIRELFSTRRPIDRPIEKVIDYYAVDEHRLRAEIEEYEVTNNVERNFEKFLDAFGHGVRTGDVRETSIWVSGFYGSGKSSFTKYLGFALDPDRTIDGQPFLELLAERIESQVIRQELRTLAMAEPVAVIMLDLGSEQLASSAVATVSTVLYWKVLQWAGYSKEEKLAQLEFLLDREGRLDEFRRAYSDEFRGSWESVHNDPLIGVARADRLVPRFFPQDFPEPGAFRSQRFSLAEDARTRADEIIDLVKRRSGRKNVLFLVDEVGQYVAPRGELILNLDGLARNFKELGQGRVWLVATGQQTLSEIVERAAYNSAELNKLRDRFPISIELDARDIREITWRRLLTKSAAGETVLRDLYRRHGQALATNTRLTGTTLFKGDPEEETFVRLYPLLPQHFDLLLELIRTLASSTGGIGLRSAIRVVQDLLVDTSKVLPAGAQLLADNPVGRLATADQFFDTLRADIGKHLPHVIAGVDRVRRAFPNDTLALRIAKAIGALQPIDNFPCTSENIAALLYVRMGDPPHLDAVREALRSLVDEPEVGLVDDPQSGGFAFLSEGVKPIRDQRNSYLPTTAEINQLRSRILKELFDPPPSTLLEAAKTVRAGVRFGRVPIVGEDEEVQLRIEAVEGGAWEARRTALLTDTTGNPEWRSSIAWLIRHEDEIEDMLVEVIRSRKVIQDQREADADRDVAQFVRAEGRAAETNEERAEALYRRALIEGILIFRGKPTPAAVAAGMSGETNERVPAAAKWALREAAAEIYPKFHLVNIRPTGDLAAKFLSVERLDRMPREQDPLGFVKTVAGRPRVDSSHPALAEALRAFREKLNQSGTTRIQGGALQDMFAAAPYGWSKDATRYVFAGLLGAGEVVFHTPGGSVQTPGPVAIEAVRGAVPFGRIGVELRDSRPSLETLDRAARQLEAVLGEAVMPLEDHVSRAARERLPVLLEPIGSLETELRLRELPGSDRAAELAETGRALLLQDGAASIPLLGAADCTFQSDLDWAKRVKSALAAGAANEVQDVRELVREADDLAHLFPQVVLVELAEREVLEDVLSSSAFYTRLADLRGVARQVRDRVFETYRNAVTAHEAELQTARDILEALPEWVDITEEDRAEVAGRLKSDFLDVPEAGREVEKLRLLLVRRAALAGLRAELGHEVERRVPPVVSENGVELQPVDLELADIVSTVVIGDEADLDRWLIDLRAAVVNARNAGAPVRIRVRR